MRYREAIKIHHGDEVVVKRTKTVEAVVEVESVEEIKGISFRLTDGNWYGYKEVK